MEKSMNELHYHLFLFVIVYVDYVYYLHKIFSNYSF